MPDFWYIERVYSILQVLDFTSTTTAELKIEELFALPSP